MFAEGVVLLGYVQFWGFSAAGLVRKNFSPFELFLQTVLVEPLKLLYALIYAVRLRCFWFLDFLNRFLFLLRRTSRIGKIIKVLIEVMTLMQLPSYNFLEILLVPILMTLLFFFISIEVHSTFRFF